MRQFIVNSKNIDVVRGRVEITGEEYHHLVNVLRKKPGDLIKVISETNVGYTLKITGIDNSIADCEIVKSEIKSSLREIEINLYQGILKSQKMNFVVQKSVELGITSITPMSTRYAVAQISSSDTEKKVSHWQRIVLAAVKQSGLPFIPEIRQPVSVTDAISSYPTLTKGGEGGFSNTLNLFLYEKFGERLSQELSTMNSSTINCINIFIGPEGGFSEQEAKLAQENQFKIVNLGQNILRSETASIVAISALLFWVKEI